MAFFATSFSVTDAVFLKRVLPVLLLALLWTWETWQPVFGYRGGRLRHGARNLAIALANTLVLCLAFGSLTVLAAEWTEHSQLGLLHWLGWSWGVRLAIALVLLDGWMYLWHRANHALPLLWRFHRMHHSDPGMDVTTATRFHLGEHVGAQGLRLGLIPLLGVDLWALVIYDTAVIAITQFHHADISLGRCDRWLRWLIVTPDMHKVHHSEWQPETDSNYSTVLSMWDRLAGSFRLRADPKTLVYGLEEFAEPRWQTLWGMCKTPFKPRDEQRESRGLEMDQPTQAASAGV
jgi:sterol desaturase/sphingolipid hydroxylase (fatty acid hydroxylase superfamily)